MILNETETRNGHVQQVAKAIMAAARTAPKGKGVDRLEIITLTGSDLKTLATQMRTYAKKSGFKFFLRDASNVEQAEAVILIGTTYGVSNLNCGYCGFPTCTEKMVHPAIPCVFNTGDLGIAIGSAVSIAADFRIDSRVFYSAGRSAIDLGLLGDSEAAFAIVLSCTSKNPFFDRVSAKG